MVLNIGSSFFGVRESDRESKQSDGRVVGRVGARTPSETSSVGLPPTGDSEGDERRELSLGKEGVCGVSVFFP